MAFALQIDEEIVAQVTIGDQWVVDDCDMPDAWQHKIFHQFHAGWVAAQKADMSVSQSFLPVWPPQTQLSVVFIYMCILQLLFDFHFYLLFWSLYILN